MYLDDSVAVDVEETGSLADDDHLVAKTVIDGKTLV